MSSEIDNNQSLDEHKKIVEQFVELTWNQGRFNLARNLVRRDFNYQASLMDQTIGFDLAAQMIQMIRHSMEDFEVVLEEVVAEGNKVVTQSSFFGTLVKPMLGFQPCSNVVTFSAISFWHFKKGKIHRLSTLLDTAELMRQMNHEDKNLKLNLTELENS
jgi:steroid delta-isomerase-like uncharacterized protein